MNKIFLLQIMAVALVSTQTPRWQRWQYYEKSITFTVFNNLTSEGEITTFDKNLKSHGCDDDGNIAIIVHGWLESFKSLWVKNLIDNLIEYRGGCVVFMDYSKFSEVSSFVRLVPHFHSIADLLLRKIKQIGNYDRMFLFGFSFGSRLCFEAGAKLGRQVIDRIDACDPAGPMFDFNIRTVDPKKAAKHVSCINTSRDKGTRNHNCHQNFLMGKCGMSQLAAGPFPLGSHGLCPHFYNSAFAHNFTANNLYKCASERLAKNIPDNFTMGYMKTPKELTILGDIFVPTSKEFPWNDMNN